MVSVVSGEEAADRQTVRHGPREAAEDPPPHGTAVMSLLFDGLIQSTFSSTNKIMLPGQSVSVGQQLGTTSSGGWIHVCSSLCSGPEKPRDRHPAEEDRRGAEPGRADPVPEEVLGALQPRWVQPGLSEGRRQMSPKRRGHEVSADFVFQCLRHTKRRSSSSLCTTRWTTRRFTWRRRSEPHL